VIPDKISFLTFFTFLVINSVIIWWLLKVGKDRWFF
jgi:hypothetical protein